MFFQLQQEDSSTQARTGLIKTDHGEIKTPIFMPVGTQASVKAVAQDRLRDDINAEIVLGNTYHLYLRPGTEIIQSAGGLHQFMSWDRPILTDSGGFQVYSISDQRKIVEEGVLFKSHIDGSKIMFSPESVIDTQRQIGADIIMAFDECTPYPSTKEYAEKSMHITHRWLDRCIAQFNSAKPLYGYHQEFFPIIQGSVYSDLRKQSAEYCIAKNTAGIAIGGLSVGEPHEDMYRITSELCDMIPKTQARYLMGVGTPANILECISRGIDMFDCVMPTRNARNAMLFTKNGTINLRNKKWAKDFSPIDEELSPEYSKAYVKHLMKAGEYLGGQIASEHNLKFYLWLVREARKQIELGTFGKWKDQLIPKLQQRL